MRPYAILLVLSAAAAAAKQVSEVELELQEVLAAALQEPRALTEVLADLHKSRDTYRNTTLMLLTKYIIKREVDKYRARDAQAVRRRVFSAHVMKLLDISKDAARGLGARGRVRRAHRQYLAAGARARHDDAADRQLFHACVRLYDILTSTRKMLWKVRKAGKVTAAGLAQTLRRLGAKPVHFGIGLLVQYHLRRATNYAVRHNIPAQLAADGSSEQLLELAAQLLPAAELVDLHLAHSSPLFSNTCPDSWLGILTPHVDSRLGCDDGEC